MIQCRHKICLKQRFDIDDFDVRHHFRQSLHAHLGNVRDIVTPFQLNVNNIDSYNDDNSDSELENSYEIQTNNRTINTAAQQVDTIVTHNNLNSHDVNRIKFGRCHTGHLSVRDIMKIQSEVASKYDSCPSEIKMFISGLPIKLKDIASKGGEGKDEFETNDDSNNSLNKQMSDIIHNYKNSFAGKHNSFIGSNDTNVSAGNKCSNSMLRSQS